MMEQIAGTPGAQYRGKTALVLGAARSGTAAAALLLRLGARVILNDTKPPETLGSLPDALKTSECKIRLGQTPEELFHLCDFIILSPGIPLASLALDKAKAAGIPILGELAFAASCAKQDIIAVSGTNGKTTTVSLLGEIFRQVGRIAHVAGNIGYPLSAAVMNAAEDDLLIAEVSSFQMETAGTFHPRAAAMLNITPDHLDRHGSMLAYTGMKKRLFDHMDPADLAVLNQDDPMVAAMAGDIRAGTIWFSSTVEVPRGAMLRDGSIITRIDGVEQRICAVSDMKIPGRHNWENTLAAAAVAAGMGVPGPVISFAIRQFHGVEHRIEYAGTVSGVRWLNDSKGTNPDSTMKAVEAMTGQTVLIAGGYDKQVPFDTLADCIAASGHIRCAVLQGQTAEKIRLALLHAGFEQIYMASTLKEAVDQAAGLAREGDSVLFSPACASFDQFKDYEQRGLVFKQLVKNLGGEGA
jgi:UDP-N-acetylmuramoylalanine--D-glutamate ligase